MKTNGVSSFFRAEPPSATDSRPRRLDLAKRTIHKLLSSADIQLNGTRSWDPQIHNDNFYKRILMEGTVGIGESYTDGWWDCEALDEMCCRAIRARIDENISFNWPTIFSIASSNIFNLQNKRRAQQVGKIHYDLGNDFFESMLDSYMQYSCAYFRNTDLLAEAQILKLDLICRKLGLKKDMRLLDIGCGWGGLARYAAHHYNCQVVGVTISREQRAYAENLCRGLPVEIRLQDYRDLSESFDRIVSVGMMEHVGHKNYRTYLKVAHQCLEDGGLFLCQSIGNAQSRTFCDPWIARYIFPNSMLPSISQVARAAEGLFVIEDIQNIGADYDRTLLAWEQNFRESWHRFSDRYSERFRRMWRFYLLCCAGAFRARSLQLFQFLFSKGGISGGIASVR